MDAEIIWDGERLDVDELAMFVATTIPGALSITPIPIFAAIGFRDERRANRVVRPERIGHFLTIHAECEIVCYDVGELHWVLQGHLARASDSRAIHTLWEFSRTNRLHDICLLDQLVRLSRAGNARFLRRSLCDLAAKFEIAPVDEDLRAEAYFGTYSGRDWSQIPQEAFRLAVARADAILGVFTVLRRRATALATRLIVDEAVVSRYGLLGLGLQVQAAIACRQASRAGLQIDPLERVALKHACETTVKNRSEELIGNQASRRCFKTEGGQLQFTRKGLSDQTPKTLMKWLEARLASVQAIDDHAFLAPRAGKIRPSVDPFDWDDVANLDPLLKAWCECSAAAELGHDLARRTQPVMHPTYCILPSMRSRHPNLPIVRQLAPGGAFEPSHGMRFIVVTLRDLELRALAQVCQHEFGKSELARLLQEGLDPYAYAADRLQQLSQDIPHALSGPGRTNQNEWLRSARAMLYAVPRGCGESTIRRIAESEYGVESSVSLIEHLFVLLTEDVFPELYHFLANDSADALAANLGMTKAEFLKRHEMEIGITFQPSAFQAQLMRFGDVSGSRSIDVWRRLDLLNQNPRLQRLLDRKEFSAELYEASLGRQIVTMSGRIWGRLSFCSARRTTYLSLADDTVKAAIYAVVAAGYRLTGVWGKEFVVEVSENGNVDDVVEDLRRTATAGASRVLTEVPVQCEATPQDHW